MNLINKNTLWSCKMKSNFEIQDEAKEAIKILEQCFLHCLDNGITENSAIGNILQLKGDCDPKSKQPGWAMGFIATRLIKSGKIEKLKDGNNRVYYNKRVTTD
jgi:hypothetical protein